MRHYEIIYIINPNESDDEFNAIAEKYNNLIVNRKGVIIKTQKWGKQRLAYTVKKFNNGFYVLVDFCANPGVTAELERSLNLDDRIIKYQTVKLSNKADPQELIDKEQEAQKEAALIADREVVEKTKTEAEAEGPKSADADESEVENG
ncbi:MAG: 30S ribosomal protein S6 [Deltaproteobacteria bacterium]|nr:30S ribosomal protein S6 [Deltaproteobacteria bacterium]